jgi:hypothetical protein
MTVLAPIASGEESRVRWDIATATCSGTNPAYPFNPYPCTLDPNGIATALAVDCTLFTVGAPVGCTAITLSGSGTFALPDDQGSSAGVSGGGSWQVCSVTPPSSLPPFTPLTCLPGTITTGTFVVTELVHWQKSQPLEIRACGACETTDNIGNLKDATGGLAVLRVAYSDGTTGILTLACAGLVDPANVSEGLTATKGVVMNTVVSPVFNVPPLPPTYPVKSVVAPILFWYAGPDAYTVEFHISQSSE